MTGSGPAPPGPRPPTCSARLRWAARASPTAVRAALRDLHRDDRLAANPADRIPAGPGGVLQPAGRAARGDPPAPSTSSAAPPGVRRPRRVLDRTFVRPAPTQEAAAEVLGLPFSTYRRHLAAAIDELV